jgi:hypothetical protein
LRIHCSFNTLAGLRRTFFLLVSPIYADYGMRSGLKAFAKEGPSAQTSMCRQTPPVACNSVKPKRSASASKRIARLLACDKRPEILEIATHELSRITGWRIKVERGHNRRRQYADNIRRDLQIYGSLFEPASSKDAIDFLLCCRGVIRA